MVNTEINSLKSTISQLQEENADLKRLIVENTKFREVFLAEFSKTLWSVRGGNNTTFDNIRDFLTDLETELGKKNLLLKW